MAEKTETIEDVRALLSAFNDGYAKRNPAASDDFMNLFARDDHLEFIGVGGILPGRGAWRVGREAVRDLVRCDWDYWGSVNIDVEKAHIAAFGDTAWVSTAGTVTTDDETEEFLGDKEEILGVVRNMSASGSRVKPLRMTAILVKQDGQWRFLQIHFSFSVRSLPK